jgi:hypothetical protein
MFSDNLETWLILLAAGLIGFVVGCWIRNRPK